jgi:hypothetical protein
MKFKLFNIYFILAAIIIGLIANSFIHSKVERDERELIELRNDKNIVLNQVLINEILNYFNSVYNNYVDVLDRYNVKSFESINLNGDLEFKAALAFTWNKEYDSEFYALKEYSENESTRKINSPNEELKYLIRNLEILRLESIEASIFLDQNQGSFLGSLGRNFISGFVTNFSFYDSELKEELTDEIAGVGTTEFYMYLDSPKILQYLFSITYIVGLLTPWYLLSLIIIKFWKTSSKK